MLSTSANIPVVHEDPLSYTNLHTLRHLNNCRHERRGVEKQEEKSEEEEKRLFFITTSLHHDFSLNIDFSPPASSEKQTSTTPSSACPGGPPVISGTLITLFHYVALSSSSPSSSGPSLSSSVPLDTNKATQQNTNNSHQHQRRPTSVTLDLKYPSVCVKEVREVSLFSPPQQNKKEKDAHDQNSEENGGNCGLYSAPLFTRPVAQSTTSTTKKVSNIPDSNHQHHPTAAEKNVNNNICDESGFWIFPDTADILGYGLEVFLPPAVAPTPVNSDDVNNSEGSSIEDPKKVDLRDSGYFALQFIFEAATYPSCCIPHVAEQKKEVDDDDEVKKQQQDREDRKELLDWKLFSMATTSDEVEAVEREPGKCPRLSNPSHPFFVASHAEPIQLRQLLPCQDTPSIRTTYSASISVMGEDSPSAGNLNHEEGAEGPSALMSANISTPNFNDFLSHRHDVLCQRLLLPSSSALEGKEEPRGTKKSKERLRFLFDLPNDHHYPFTDARSGCENKPPPPKRRRKQCCWYFVQSRPIPSYLIAFAATASPKGFLFVDLSPRVRLYALSEKQLQKNGVEIFMLPTSSSSSNEKSKEEEDDQESKNKKIREKNHDDPQTRRAVEQKNDNNIIETILQTLEQLTGVAYPFGPRYDILLYPGGCTSMENPNMMFLTGNNTLGKQGFLQLLRHEISHNWCGNFLTCANWSNVWWNEGGATYLQRRVSEVLMGKEQEEWEKSIGVANLELGVFADTGGDETHPLTSLTPQLNGWKRDQEMIEKEASAGKKEGGEKEKLGEETESEKKFFSSSSSRNPHSKNDDDASNFSSFIANIVVPPFPSFSANHITNLLENASIQYEKGYCLFMQLEDLVGGKEKFLPWLGKFFTDFGFQSITSDDVKMHFCNYFLQQKEGDNNIAEKVKAFPWDEVLHGRGMPKWTPCSTGGGKEKSEEIVEYFFDDDGSSPNIEEEDDNEDE